MTKLEIEHLVEVEEKLSTLRSQRYDIEKQIQTLAESQRDLVKRYGNTGQVFKSGDIYIKARDHNEYAGLTIIRVEEAE